MQWLIDIVKEWIVAQGYALESWVEAKGYLTHGFVNRGPGAPPDFTHTDLDMDDIPHDLDVSGIVPEGAVAILFALHLMDVNVQRYIFLATDDTYLIEHQARLKNQVSMFAVTAHKVVPCNPDRIIRYEAGPGASLSIQINVLGWWL